MYWGNPGIPCTDSEKMDVLYDELKHCQEISMGPNFVVSFYNTIDGISLRIYTRFPTVSTVNTEFLWQILFVSIANRY